MCVYVGSCASVHVFSALFLSLQLSRLCSVPSAVGFLTALDAQDWSDPMNYVTSLKASTALPTTAMFQQVACPLLKSSSNLPIYSFQLGLFP